MEWRALGIIFIVVPLLIAAGAFVVMLRAKTNIDPYHPTTALVMTGPFRYTRNPLYVSLAMLYVGLSIELGFTGSLLLLPVALVVMHFGVVRREERYLERKFGDEYRAYMVRTRRWI
jgi:protein-S-isoprenylcysteine O-methyltransferase Ste14